MTWHPMTIFEQSLKKYYERIDEEELQLREQQRQQAMQQLAEQATQEFPDGR